MTTYTTVIMQMSQNRLKSRLKDFHIRLKYLSIVDYKVTDLLIMHLSTDHLNAFLKVFTPIESGARSMQGRKYWTFLWSNEQFHSVQNKP